MSYQGHRVSSGTSDKKLAEKIRAKWITELTEETWFDKRKISKITISDILQNLDETKSYTVRWAKNTRKYHDFWAKNIGGELLKNVSKKVIAKVITMHLDDKAAQTQLHYKNYLQNAYENAISDMELNIANPCRYVRIKVDNARSRKLSDDEEIRLLNASEGLLNGDLRDMIAISIDTGLRKMELLTLQWKHKDSNVNFGENVITVLQTKTGKTKIIPMSNRVRNILLKRRGIGFVFKTSSGTPYSKSNLDRDWWKAIQKANLEDFRWHDLRHTCGSRLASRQDNRFAVKNILGHSDWKSTDRYVHLETETLKKAVNDAFNS
jgi:integrase